MAVKKIHEAEQYAHDVVNGKIVSCELLRLCCERYFRDLNNSLDKGWYFDAYRYLNEVMQRAAQTLRCRLTWGGDWIKLRDGVHWQLEDRLSTYPALIR